MISQEMMQVEIQQRMRDAARLQLESEIRAANRKPKVGREAAEPRRRHVPMFVARALRIQTAG